MKPEVSTSAEINPYESPAEAGGYNAAAPAVISVWRDDKLLVIHPQATLPAFCIQTGQPAERFVRCVVSWHYPIDWNTRRLEIDVPFSESGYRDFASRWRTGVMLTILGA